MIVRHICCGRPSEDKQKKTIKSHHHADVGCDVLIWILKDRLEIGESRGKAPYTGEIAKMRVVSENTWSILGMPSG